MIPEVTANQAFIHGAIHAVISIKKPCRICIIVPTSLGFEKAFQGKGVNVSLIFTLYETISQKGCELTEARFINGADIIKKYIAMNSGNSSFAANMERKASEKVDRVKQYKMSIYRECLGKVCDILKDEGISEDIIYKVKEIKL